MGFLSLKACLIIQAHLYVFKGTFNTHSLYIYVCASIIKLTGFAWISQIRTGDSSVYEKIRFCFSLIVFQRKERDNASYRPSVSSARPTSGRSRTQQSEIYLGLHMELYSLCCRHDNIKQVIYQINHCRLQVIYYNYYLSQMMTTCV